MKINSLPKPIQFLIKCIEGDIDTINLCKDKIVKLHTNEIYVQFLDHFGLRTNISKIDFSRQLNKFGLQSKQFRMSGSNLRGYVLDYNKIITKFKDLKIEIKVKHNDNTYNNSNINNSISINDLDFA